MSVEENVQNTDSKKNGVTVSTTAGRKEHTHICYPWLVLRFLRVLLRDPEAGVNGRFVASPGTRRETTSPPSLAGRAEKLSWSIRCPRRRRNAPSEGQRCAVCRMVQADAQERRPSRRRARARGSD